MTDLTPAQTQADFLTTLAGHLHAHPHLPEVNISSLGNGWQLFTSADGPAGLIAWAHSLGATRLVALPIDHADWSAVRCTCSLSDVEVETFARIDGFPRDVTALSVTDLEHFAEHGTLPRQPGVWTTQTVRDAVTNAHLHLAEAGHEDVDRDTVANALAAAGITEGAVR